MQKKQDYRRFPGKYKGTAHVKCNLDFSFWYVQIHIFFHNLKNYEAHFIIAKANELNIELNQNKKNHVIAQNSDKFITFSFGLCQIRNRVAFSIFSIIK